MVAVAIREPVLQAAQGEQQATQSVPMADAGYRNLSERSRRVLWPRWGRFSLL